MDYLTWNDSIASFFFNEDMADKEVYLYITKEDIIGIGQEKISNKSNNEIWQDFINAVKEGYNNKVDDTDILETLLWIFEYYKKQKQLGANSYHYPIYIAYLTLFILPLTEDNLSNVNPNDYYSPINSFLNVYGLPALPRQSIKCNWNKVWEDLKYWSIYEKNCELGYFEIHEFGNPNWKFVSKPLSQCLIKLSSIKKLPILFYQNNILPNQNIKEEKIRNLLINSSHQLDLKTSLLKAIKDDTEFGNLLVKIVKRFYEKWNGEETSYSKKEIEAGVKKPWTLAAVRLGININFNDEKVDFFFRIYSKNEFPEELVFNDEINVHSEVRNWSEKLKIPAIEILKEQNGLILEDQYNRWKAIFKKKDVIFFSSGTDYSLNGWLETETISVSDEVFILCDETGFHKVAHYLKDDSSIFLKRIDYEGLDKLYLYKVIKNLPDDFFKQNNIIIPENISIVFNNMLKLNQRDYLKDINPSITIHNITQDKLMILKYYGSEEEIILEKIKDHPVTFKLPKKIKEDVNIELHLKNGQQYKILDVRVIKSFNNSNYYSEIPFRNSWAEITENSFEYLWRGNELQKQFLENSLYGQSQHHFLPELNASINKITKLDRDHPIYIPIKDIMLLFLSSTGKISFEKYFAKFEQIIFTHNDLEKLKHINNLKYFSLRYLESLGHIDVDYINQKILINKPKIILIPNNKFIGRQAILIGARSYELIEDLIKKSKELKIKTQIENSIDLETGLEYIIPQVIKLSVQGNKSDNYGENRIQSLCIDLKILYNLSILVQPLLLITTSKIVDYENRLIEDEGEDYEWARQIFNPVNLKFERFSNEINKDLCLLKYHFTNYHIRYKLWLNGKCYIENNIRNKGIDPEWGRYFILYKKKKNILLFDEDTSSLAVPLTVPLPKFINKALTMMSGYIPDQKEINGNTYNVYSNLIPSLTYNIFSQLGQNIRNTI